MENDALEVRHLAAAYDRRPVLDAVSFSVPRGAMVGIVGPNGSGKSTLLKAVLGLVPVVRGEIDVLGRGAGPQARRLVGYVPQREEVNWNFPVSAFDVVMMGRVPSLRFLRQPGDRDRELVWKALEIVGMAGPPVVGSMYCIFMPWHSSQSL